MKNEQKEEYSEKEIQESLKEPFDYGSKEYFEIIKKYMLIEKSINKNKL